MRQALLEASILIPLLLFEIWSVCTARRRGRIFLKLRPIIKRIEPEDFRAALLLNAVFCRRDRRSNCLTSMSLPQGMRSFKAFIHQAALAAWLSLLLCYGCGSRSSEESAREEQRIKDAATAYRDAYMSGFSILAAGEGSTWDEGCFHSDVSWRKWTICRSRSGRWIGRLRGGTDAPAGIPCDSGRNFRRSASECGNADIRGLQDMHCAMLWRRGKDSEDRSMPGVEGGLQGRSGRHCRA